MRQEHTLLTHQPAPIHEKRKDEQPSGDDLSIEELAHQLVDQGRYQDAVELFEVNPLSRLESILTSLRSKLTFVRAKELIETAAKTYPKSPGIQSELGWLYYSNEQYDDALNVFNQSLLIQADHGSALQGKIATLRLLRRFQDANKMLLETADSFPDHLGIQSERGWVLFDQKRYDKASEVFETVYKKGDNSVLKWIISCFRLQRRFQEAQTWMLKAHGLKPNDVEILNEEGWLSFDRKQYENALIRFNHALEIDDRHEFGLQGRIASLRLLRRYAEAEGVLREALRTHPKSTGILIERSWLLIDQNKSLEASESFDAAVNLVPNRMALKFSRIDGLISMDEGYRALELLKELRESYPDDIEIMDRLGRLYLRRNELKNAEGEFQGILKKDATHVLGLNGLGAVYFSYARYADASKIFSRVIQEDPNNALAHTNLARALIRQDAVTKRRWRTREVSQLFRATSVETNPSGFHRLEEAEAHCKKALKIDSKSAHAYGCLGIIAYKRGNLSEAEELFQTSIKMDPQEGSYRDLGALYVVTKQHDKAEENLTKALEINKDDAVAHVELGYLYDQTGKIEQALREFHRAKSLDPNNDEPPRAIATVYMRNNNFDEAEDILRNSLKTLDKSRRWQVHLTLCRLLTQKGDETEESLHYEEALMEAKKAKRLKPEHGDPYFHIGIIMAKQKDYRAALKNLRFCLNKNSHHYEAELSKRRVQAHLRKERSGSYFWVGFCVGVLCVSQLVLLWYYFSQDKVTGTILSVLIPVLLGLVMVGFLMPWVIKFKMPGLEVGLVEQKEPIYQGPKGEVGFSKASATISSGPL